MSTRIVVMLICSIVLIIQSPYALTIDQLIVFGDSLSDNGNLYALTSLANKKMPQIPIIPKSPPYYEGRFSNGLVWVEHVAQSMDIPMINYAYGGSWAESYQESNLKVPFGLGLQVDFYLAASVLDFQKDKHLFIIWSGANDYVKGRDNAEYATTTTVATIKNQIEWLAYYGAKHFLVLNLPDLSLVPEVTEMGPDYAAKIKHLIQLHNQKLADMIVLEKEMHPDITILDLNIFEYFNDVISNPDKYHLKNVTTQCYFGGYWLRSLSNIREIQAAKELNIDIMNSPSLRTAYITAQQASMGKAPCENPDDYLFWDHIHPTRILHQLLATMVLGVLDENDIAGK